METKRKNTGIVITLLALVILLAIVPLFLKKGAEFGGSDDAGSVMVEEVSGKAYTPWFTSQIKHMQEA